MSEYKRLPRKLKKDLKNNFPEEWNKLVEERRTAKEKHESLDIIFTRNYDNSHKIVRRMIRTGR